MGPNCPVNGKSSPRPKKVLRVSLELRPFLLSIKEVVLIISQLNTFPGLPALKLPYRESGFRPA